MTLEWRFEAPVNCAEASDYAFRIMPQVHVGLTFYLSIVHPGTGKLEFSKSGFRTREGAKKQAEKWLKARLKQKDETDLVAAALGLKSSAWAQAEVHLTEPKFNAAINGKQVLKDGELVDDTTSR